MGCWYPIQRALAAGVVIEDRSNPWVPRNRHALFANERDQVIFNPRHELLHGQPSLERAEQIMAEVDRLRAEQAATWAGPACR
jgi:hypothetical protein